MLRYLLDTNHLILSQHIHVMTGPIPWRFPWPHNLVVIFSGLP
jgi:hypothetical protein